MKLIVAEEDDLRALQDLGRASVQIVHDLKNQLNGLKLYATFLRKRMERRTCPADELETINKLIAGIERAIADASVLVQFGRPIELRRQPCTDLVKLIHGAIGEGFESIEAPSAPVEGSFDQAALTEAFKAILAGTQSPLKNSRDERLIISLRLDNAPQAIIAIVEWRGIDPELSAEAFQSCAGGRGVRLALAAKIIRAHGGQVEHKEGCVRVRLPLRTNEHEPT